MVRPHLCGSGARAVHTPSRARKKRIIPTEESNILEARIGSLKRTQHAPSIHRGGFSIHRAVFEIQNTPLPRCGLCRFHSQHEQRHPKIERGAQHSCWSAQHFARPWSPVLEIGAPKQCRLRCVFMCDGTTRLVRASYFDAMTLFVKSWRFSVPSVHKANREAHGERPFVLSVNDSRRSKIADNGAIRSCHACHVTRLLPRCVSSSVPPCPCRLAQGPPLGSQDATRLDSGRYPARICVLLC